MEKSYGDVIGSNDRRLKEKIHRQTERVRETSRQRSRQTERQADRMTGRQRDRQTIDT